MDNVPFKKLHSVTPELSAQIVQGTQEFLENREDIQFAFIYGSFVELDMFHDVDLGISLQCQCLDRSTDIALEAAGQLSRRFRLPFDVRVLNGAPVSLLYHVFRGRLVFCRDAGRLSDDIEYVLARYFDKHEFLRHYTREAFAL